VLEPKKDLLWRRRLLMHAVIRPPRAGSLISS